MEQLQAGLDPQDGVAAFNRMYLEVTKLVRDNLSAGFFGDPVAMAKLDVVFAGLYLNAVDAPDRSTPKAWAPLFDQRERAHVESIQFALAGMNAHINHDLPLAVVLTCEQLGINPTSQPFADDYEKVTTLLCQVEEQVRQSYLSGIALRADREVSGVVTLIGNWSIGAARKAAWANALALWAIRDVEPVREEFLKALARSVGMASTYLLTPAKPLSIMSRD
jgi:hypothetical protein